MRIPADDPTVVWSAMKQRLLAGDALGASSYFSALSAANYLKAFLSFTAADLVSTTGQIPGISPVFMDNDTAQYRFDQTIQGVTITFPVNFVRENGVWKILEY